MTQQPSSDLDQYLAHFQWRVLQDALAQATADHWEQRAAALEWARPRPGDHRGTDQTPANTAATYDELTRLANTCRWHAALLRDIGLDADARAAIAVILTEPQVA